MTNDKKQQPSAIPSKAFPQQPGTKTQEQRAREGIPPPKPRKPG
jgi:hypothetical protein